MSEDMATNKAAAPAAAIDPSLYQQVNFNTNLRKGDPVRITAVRDSDKLDEKILFGYPFNTMQEDGRFFIRFAGNSPSGGSDFEILSAGKKLFSSRVNVPGIPGAFEATVGAPIINGMGPEGHPPCILEVGQNDFSQGLPAIPTREQANDFKQHLQGLWYDTKWGRIPAWGLDVIWEQDREHFDGCLAAHRDVGDSHLVFDLTWAYREPGTILPWQLLNGRDWTQSLRGFKDMLLYVIKQGFFIDLPLGGDGLSVNPNPGYRQYNDPVGDTYGYEWLMANIGRVVKALRGDFDSECADGLNTLPWIVFRPGWDAVFYGWSKAGEPDSAMPARVRAFGAQLKVAAAPNDVLLYIEHDMGHIPTGKGPADFEPGGTMEDYDGVMSEYENGLERTNDQNPDTNPGTQFWMIADRLAGEDGKSTWRRPADMPNGPQWDPSPPFYLGAKNKRGHYIRYVGYEWGIYLQVRGRYPTAQCDQDRAYVRNCGVRHTG